MFIKTLKHYVRWIAINLAVTTMVFSPVALGREAESLNEKKLQMYLQEFGLNGKKVTLGEFWEKTKVYYPGFIYKDLEKFVSENKNMQMPELTVTNAKATDGSIVPVLRVTSGSKSATIQIFDERNKWAKYNNVVLSEEDLRSVGDAFKRIEASDVRLKKEAETYLKVRSEKALQSKRESTQYLEKMVKDFARFNGFPRMTPLQWKQMTPTQRAQFIVSMRALWKDARQVLRLQEAADASQKTGAKGRKFSSFDEFSKILLGEQAEAAGDGKAKKARREAGAGGARDGGDSDLEAKVPPPVSNAERVAIIAGFAPKDSQSKKCIVLGYASTEGRGVNYSTKERDICSEENVFKSEKYTKDTPLARMVQEAQKSCQLKGTQYSACNPAVYSYDVDGNAICVDRTQKTPEAPAAGNFQKATWWEGPCDAGSKLTSQQIQDSMSAKDSKYAEDSKRYDESGQMKMDVARDQIARIEDDQMKNESFKQTKTFVDNALKSKGQNLAGLLDPKAPWKKEHDDMLVEIQTQFESEIGDAIQACEKSVARKDNVDRNQKGACDQLHRRWLFTERIISQYRAKSCLGKSTYIWKLDDTKLSKDQANLAESNKKKTESDELCQCTDIPGKKIKFNEEKGCEPHPVPAAAKCPEGMEEEKTLPGFCRCPGQAMYLSVEDAIRRVKGDTLANVCPAGPESKDCGKPKGILGYDYERCECKQGELKDENEQGFLSKIFSGAQVKKDPKWVCKETDLLPWVLGGLGILALVAIFNKHKKPVNPPSTVVCGLTCTGNTALNPAACRCDANPPVVTCAPKVGTYPNCTCPLTNTCGSSQKYNMQSCACDTVNKCADGSEPAGNNLSACPKCSDGSYRGMPTTGRPDGCPQSSEGGSGSAACATPPCSGGVPTAH